MNRKGLVFLIGLPKITGHFGVSVCPELPFENSVCCEVCSADVLHFRKFQVPTGKKS